MTQQNRHDESNQTVHLLALGLLVTMDAQQCLSSERCVQEIFLWPIKDLVLNTERFVGLFGFFFFLELYPGFSFYMCTSDALWLLHLHSWPHALMPLLKGGRRSDSLQS